MSAAQLQTVLDNQAACPAAIDDSEQIETWRAVAERQRHHNP